MYGRTFSLRNGMGPVIAPTLDSMNDESPQLAQFRELYDLLTTFTSAEEAAIRQITPMVSIVRLTHGNLATKGNTTCVWQQSKLNLVLPNLPQSCQFIVIKRTSSTTSQVKSTRFKRERISRALVLLKDTFQGVWGDITISEENLSHWVHEDGQEDGDICTLNSSVVVLERDEEGNLYTDHDDDENNNAVGTDNIQGATATADTDMGPAPLQNVRAEEEYEGALDMANAGGGNAAEAPLVAQALQQVIQDIRNPPTLPDTEVPVPTYNRNKTTAHFEQPDIFSTDGLANMNKISYAWARAFPTLFIPTWDEHVGEWRIYHDITGWGGLRDQGIKFVDWCDYLMWRSDGRCVSHPTFALVLSNHKMKEQCQKQGSYVLNTSGMDVATTLKEIQQAGEGEPIEQLTRKVLNNAQVHTSNIPGTDAYWTATYHEFQALNFYYSYVKDEEITAFHTGSLAEYHEYSLRLLLSKYVSKLTNTPPDLPQQILDDDTAFARAVQMYKNVVTHYLESKMEIWMTLFMKPVFGVTSGQLTNEFAQSRGAIHFHSVLRIKNETTTKIQAGLKVFALAIDDAMHILNEYITKEYEQDSLSWFTCHEIVGNPATKFSPKALENRATICQKTHEGKDVWLTYNDSVNDAKAKCDEEIGQLVEAFYGIQALHSGNFPDDLVKPGSVIAKDNYRETSDDMQTSQNILDRKELKLCKFHREDHLFERKINIDNHCRMHHCSSYCAKEKKFKQPYDEALHSNIREDDRFEDEDGNKWAMVPIKDCRHGFGKLLTFDCSGENNLTRGIAPVREPYIEADNNGQLRLFARRNNPRLVQEPSCFPYYGANNDTQIMLINATSKSTLSELGPERYERFSNNLVAAGYGGLEHYNGAHILNEYLTKYHTKGTSNSRNFAECQRSITEDYCNRDNNEDLTVRSLMAKHMAEVTKSISAPKDQAIYLLAQGKLKRRSGEGSVKKCSVSSHYISDIANNIEGGVLTRVSPSIGRIFSGGMLHDLMMQTLMT